MGNVQHKTIVVTGFDSGRIKRFTRAHNKAKILFPGLVSRRIRGVTNGYESFLVASCGSQLGWSEDSLHQGRLDNFIEFLESLKYEDGSTNVGYVYATVGDVGLTIRDHLGHEIDEG